MSNNTVTKQQAAAKAEVILLGIDVHADRQVVVRQIDGQMPQPAQQFSREQLVEWISRQRKLAKKVYSCYEAGPFGYGLHRELAALGVENLVVRPRNWDEYGKQVKTDKRDARALTEALDRYLRGNRHALSVVRVPSPQEEQQRSLGRQREALARELRRLATMGRSHALYYGERLAGQWWKPRAWKRLEGALEGILLKLLEPLRRLILAIEQELGQATAGIESQATPVRPKGLGALSSELISREVGDWNRFSNRRQVASYCFAPPHGAHPFGAAFGWLSRSARLRPVPRRALQRQSPFPRQHHQARQPAVAAAVGRGQLAPDPFPTRLPAA